MFNVDDRVKLSLVIGDVEVGTVVGIPDKKGCDVLWEDHFIVYYENRYLAPIGYYPDFLERIKERLG